MIICCENNEICYFFCLAPWINLSFFLRWILCALFFILFCYVMCLCLSALLQPCRYIWYAKFGLHGLLVIVDWNWSDDGKYLFDGKHLTEDVNVFSLNWWYILQIMILCICLHSVNSCFYHSIIDIILRGVTLQNLTSLSLC